MKRLHRAAAAVVVFVFAARAPLLAGEVVLPEISVADPQWRGAMASFTGWLGTPQGLAAASENPSLQGLRALTPAEIERGETIGPLVARLAPGLAAAVRDPAALSGAERSKLFNAIARAQREARPEVGGFIDQCVGRAKSGALTADELRELSARIDGFQFYGGSVGTSVRAAHALLAKAAMARAEVVAAALKDERDSGGGILAVRVAARSTSLSHLSKAERRQVVRAELAAEQLPAAVRDAVVLGGGPSGLMSAFNLLKHDARVTIIEQRDVYNRPIHFNIRQSLLDQLDYFDPVLVPRVLDKMGVIERAEFIDATIGQKLDRPVPSIRKPDGRLRIASGRTMMESPSVGQIKVSDLEQILSQRLREIAKEDLARGTPPRVRIISDAQPALVRGKDDLYSVAAQPIEARVDRNGRTERAPAGSAVDLGTPDLIVVAEGANSSARDLLGVKRQPTSPETRFIAGYIDRDSGGLIRRRYAETRDGETGEVHGVRQIAVGHSKNGKTWSLVEVPEDVKLETREEIRAYYIQEAAKILEISAEQAAALAIEWGPSLFRLQQWIADTAVPAANVVLIGDAVGNAHFLTSGGVMTASVPHQQELDRLLSARALGTMTPEQQRHVYDARVRADTLEWARLGIREFGRQVVAANFGSQFTQLLADLRRAKGLADQAPVDLGPRSLKTSEAERALEGSPQGDVVWNGPAQKASR